METVVVYAGTARGRGTVTEPEVSLYREGNIGVSLGLLVRLGAERYRVEVDRDAAGVGRVLRLAPDERGFLLSRASKPARIGTARQRDALPLPWGTHRLPATVGEDGTVTVRLPEPAS